MLYTCYSFLFPNNALVYIYRSMVVELICDEEQTTPTFVFLNETVPLQYVRKNLQYCISIFVVNIFIAED